MSEPAQQSCVIVQMSGVPGSGKSTVAREVGAAIGAIVIDHDDTKTAIMSSGVAPDLAGKASYEVIKSVVSQFVKSGHSVVIDSPCLYPELLTFGQQLAAEIGARYRFIECRIEDWVELNRRIEERERKPSQVVYGPLHSEMIEHRGTMRTAREQFSLWDGQMQRPEDRLVLDTGAQKSECASAAIAYVCQGG